MHENGYDLEIQAEICRKQIQILVQPCLWIEWALLLINQQKLTPLILGTWGIELLPDLVSACSIRSTMSSMKKHGAWSIIFSKIHFQLAICHLNINESKKTALKITVVSVLAKPKHDKNEWRHKLCGHNLAINHISPEGSNWA